MVTRGSGNRVYGGVMANADFDTESLVAESVVTNSTCAVSRGFAKTRASPGFGPWPPGVGSIFRRSLRARLLRELGYYRAVGR